MLFKVQLTSDKKLAEQSALGWKEIEVVAIAPSGLRKIKRHRKTQKNFFGYDYSIENTLYCKADGDFVQIEENELMEEIAYAIYK